MMEGLRCGRRGTALRACSMCLAEVRGGRIGTWMRKTSWGSCLKIVESCESRGKVHTTRLYIVRSCELRGMERIKEHFGDDAILGKGGIKKRGYF